MRVPIWYGVKYNNWFSALSVNQGQYTIYYVIILSRNWCYREEYIALANSFHMISDTHLTYMKCTLFWNRRQISSMECYFMWLSWIFDGVCVSVSF